MGAIIAGAVSVDQWRQCASGLSGVEHGTRLSGRFCSFGVQIAARPLDARDFQNLIRPLDLTEVWHSLCTHQLL